MNTDGFRILIVEDNSSDSETLEGCISKANPHFRVSACISSECALQYIRNNSPDFVVLDIEIPRTDAGMASDDNGKELLAQIHEHDKWLPVLVLTKHAPHKYQSYAVHHGAISYIRKKPVRFRQQVNDVVVPVITSIWNARAKISKEYEEKREEYIAPFREITLDIFKSFTLSEAIPPHEYVETEVISSMQTLAVQQLLGGIDRNMRILDVGCGKGRFLIHLGKQIIKSNPELKDKISYIGIDPHEKMIGEAEDACNNIQIKHEFLNCSIEEYRETCNDRFDMVVSINVVHEIPSKDLLTFIRCMINLVNPQGILSLTDMGDLPEPEPYPVVWSIEEFCSILQYLGYTKEDYKSVPLPRRVPIWNILAYNKREIKKETTKDRDVMKAMLYKKIIESINSIEDIRSALEKSDPTGIRDTDGIRSFIKSHKNDKVCKKEIRKYIIEYTKLGGYVKNWMEISSE